MLTLLILEAISCKYSSPHFGNVNVYALCSLRGTSIQEAKLSLFPNNSHVYLCNATSLNTSDILTASSRAPFVSE